jgi:hypothetical protein
MNFVETTVNVCNKCCGSLYGPHSGTLCEAHGCTHDGLRQPATAYTLVEFVSPSVLFGGQEHVVLARAVRTKRAERARLIDP